MNDKPLRFSTMLLAWMDQNICVVKVKVRPNASFWIDIGAHQCLWIWVLSFLTVWPNRLIYFIEVVIWDFGGQYPFDVALTFTRSPQRVDVGLCATLKHLEKTWCHLGYISYIRLGYSFLQHILMMYGLQFLKVLHGSKYKIPRNNVSLE